MTTYGALISLQNTIHHILLSSHISLVGHSLEIIILAYKGLEPLKVILERLDSTSKSRSRKKVNVLDGRIKVKVWEFEDKLESLLSQQILSQSRSSGERDVLLFSIDLQCLRGDVGSFVQTLKGMEEAYINELGSMAEDDEDESVSSGIGFEGTKSKMIGLSDQLKQVKRNLMREFFGKDVFVLVGMAGVGKTTLAKQIYRDPEILSKFECRAWVTIGRKPQLSQLSQSIRSQLTEGDEKLSEERLKDKKCLIVLDDVWERQVLDSLIRSLPAPRNGFIQILITARERNEIKNTHPDVFGPYFKVVRFLNEGESKDLLCEKVFGEQICPAQLDKAATKIANKCEGLPLMILTVADFLSKSQNRDDPNYWDEVAEERNSVFTDAYNEITKVFLPSYDYLPQYLKMPFLYMGVFPRDYDFPPSKIMNMLTSEGWFLHTNKKQSLEVSVWQCLHELCTSKNLVLFKGKSIFWDEKISHHMYKTCRLHSTWRHVCRGEAGKNMFYQVLNKLVNGSEEGVKGRCLCLENNILFGIKGFCDSVRLNYTRSVLFFGPYHQYPISIDVGFSLLRELDALQLRFYTFPTEILSLVQLKYLALTCNGELPTTISKLFNLQILIVHPHMNIRRCRAPSFVPIQIWDMEALEHIEILGKSLVAPYHVLSLEKLLTLVGVNASICTILELSARIPNIRKLGVQIELTPYDDHNDLLSCFHCISTLGSLEILKYSIINPMLQYGYVVPLTPSSLMLPHGLKKLHLSGMGFPWDYMDVIGSLPLLQVLKLRSYAFQGLEWEAQEESFPSLEFLLIEDTDLVYLNLRSKSFPKLSYLSLKHCYKLKEICWPSKPDNLRHGKIELLDCNPLALTCAKQLQLSQHVLLDVTASSYFDEKPMTIKLLSYGLAEVKHSGSIFPDLMSTAKTDTTTFSSHLYLISIIVLLGFLVKIFGKFRASVEFTCKSKVNHITSAQIKLVKIIYAAENHESLPKSYGNARKRHLANARAKERFTAN